MLMFKEEALQEIRQAQLWYEVQRTGPGIRSRHAMRECLHFTVENPPGFAIRRSPYRAVRVGKYPYIVWYAVEGDDIVVCRLRHGKQRPLKKFAGQ